MELPEPFYELGHQFAVDLPGARVAFSTRRGGHSTGAYATLNLGWLTEDDRGTVNRNREALRVGLDAPRLSFVHQVHGAEVRRVTDGADEPHERPRVDGQATDRTDVVKEESKAERLKEPAASV